MSIRDDFFAAQAKASLWDVAVSIKRGNPLPLDANAVYASYGEFIETKIVDDKSVDVYTAGSLLEYAKTNPVAYPGQICAVVDVNETKIYYLDQNLDIQPVGIIPTGDNKSIEVAENGTVSIFGFDDLTNDKVRYLPVTKLAGEGEDAHLEIEWVAESEIAPELVAGLGIEVDGTEISAALASETKLADAAAAPETGYATVAVRADKDGNLAVVLPVDTVHIAEAVAEASHLKREIVDVLPDPANADENTIYMIKAGGASNVSYKDIGKGYFNAIDYTYVTSLDGEKYAYEITAAPGTKIKLSTGVSNYTASVYVKNGDVYGEGGAPNFSLNTGDNSEQNGEFTDYFDYLTIPKDAQVENGLATCLVVFDVSWEALNTIVPVQEGGDQYREYMLFNFGTEDEPNWQFEQIGDTSVSLDGYATEEYVDGKIQEINTALGEHAQEAKNTYATKTALKEVSDNLANNYMTAGDIAATLANYTTDGELAEHAQYAEETYAKAADVYTTEQIDEKIGTPGIPAEKDEEGNETKPAVPGTGIFANVYSKTEVTELIADITGGESAADVKAELKEYKSTNDATVKTITDEVWGKDITDFTKASRIDNLETNVGTNTTDISNLKGIVNGHNGNDGLVNKVAVLEAEVYADKTAAESRIDGLETSLGVLSTTVGGHTTKLSTLETVTIPGLDGRIGANETAVQNILKSIGTVPTGKTVMGLIGSVPEGETVIDLINAVDEKIGKIDLTPYALVTSVEEIYKKDAEGKETGLLVDEIARATGAEAALGERIDGALELIGGNTTAIATLVGNDKEKSVRTIATEVANELEHLKRKIVTELPAVEDADKDTIYMVKTALTPIEVQEGTFLSGSVGSSGLSPFDNTDTDAVVYEVQPTTKYAIANFKAGYVLKNDGEGVTSSTVLQEIDSGDNTVITEQEAKFLVLNVDAGTRPVVSSSATEGDMYKEYMLIDGAFEQIGDTSVSLEGYATEEFVTSQGYITNAALNGYATEQFVLDKGYQNADQVNALIDAKEYQLPIATNTVLGGVLSSAEGTANKVTVEATGTMKVTKITTDILANGSEELILFGGNSGATNA